ncbi:hypothetical protein POM88_048593 [Heracleum sosnowskyi]|uniref:Uncharacterized protein n=1 Tax=Heracleum sosnowskyi TaxID=360622 RepID=A0AAD8M0S8_9APIA|nr:hypothetical protein POM88_048593 [Heracleum sosnowskyi]
MRNFCWALGSSVVSNVKNGIWIADLHLVQCSFDDGCDGTMQIVEARHMDLLTNEEYQNGSGEYEQISFHEIKKHAISGCFFGFQHMSDAIISEFFGPESWAEELLMPKAMDLHAVALKTELKENEGLFIRCYVMRAGADGELVSIRISQC